MRSPEELTVAFRAAGLKVTPQRQLLFRLLHNNDTHPTADTLFTEASGLMPGISLPKPSCQCRMFVAYCQVLDLDQILGRAGQM